MRYLKDIQPYNKFWGNCITNMFLSILLKMDPSYEPIIYLNAYEYSYIEENLFHIDFTEEYYHYFSDIFVFTYSNFDNSKDFIPQLKDILVNNLYINLNVDLFYWNTEGAYYNKVHRPHFSFISGFDEEKDVFYAFEENKELVYSSIEIPTERVIQAIKSEYKDIRGDYRIISFRNNDIKPYELTLKRVIENAKRLVVNLDTFIGKEHILDKSMFLDNMSNAYFYNNEFSKIAYRLRGNILLFNTLRSKGILNEALTNQMVETVNAISMNWKVIQNSFFKCCLRNNFSEIDDIEQKITANFMKEKEMWFNVLKYLDTE